MNSWLNARQIQDHWVCGFPLIIQSSFKPDIVETILVHDQHIKAAVMFGRGKFNAGVIIDPFPQYAFDPADTTKLAEFRNKIWWGMIFRSHMLYAYGRFP